MALLKEDGRASISLLADTLDVPRSVVRARLTSLVESENVDITAIVNPSVLGLNVLCHVTMRVAGPVEPVIEQLLAIDAAAFVSITSGTFDVVAELRAPDQRQLFDLVARVRDIPAITSVGTLFYLDIYKSPFTSVNGPPIGAVSDSLDIHIMQLLQVNGRESYRDIGRRCAISPSTARARVQRLVSANIIRITAIAKRNPGTRSMAMGLGINIRGEAVSLAETLSAFDAVEFVATAIGAYDFVVTISAASLPALQTVVSAVRALDKVIRVSTWMHMEIMRENYGGITAEPYVPGLGPVANLRMP